MATKQFDYSATDTPDDVVRRVVSELTGTKLMPLSDDERREREVWRQQQYQRDLERRAEQEHRQAIADEAERQELAAEIAERNRQRRLQQQREYQERAEQRSRNLDLSALKVDAVRQQHLQSLYGELEKMLSPPAESETQLVDDVVDVEGSPELGTRNFNPALFNKKPRSWW